MPRLILVGFLVVMYFVFSIITLPISWLLGLIDTNLRYRFSYFLVSGIFKWVRVCAGVSLDVRGLENIPKDQPVLYVGNHRSYFDIIINYSILPPLMGFVSKIEIKKIPILAQWMVNMNCLFLDRSSPKEGLKMIHDGVDKLNQGTSIFIFPEGTRAKSDDAMADFKAGSLKMAEKAKVPIIPVAINNTSAIFEDQFPYIHKAKVIIEYCEPIYVDALSKEEKKFLAVHVHDIIKEKVDAHRKELES